MRKKKKKRVRSPQYIIISALLIALPVVFYLSRASFGFLGRAGERAAVFSAAIIMPDGSFDLLRERFHDELYGEQEQSAPDDDNAEHPPVENHSPKPAPQIPSPAEESSSSAPDSQAPSVPEKYAAALVSENFAGRDGGTLISYGAGFIKNETKKSNETISEILQEDFDLGFTTGDEPQVLIFHTHATESFERYDNDVYDTRSNWRSTNNKLNMVAVGNAMQQVLEANGIGVLHDATQHDYPSYNGSYERSAKTVKQYLEEYPSIKVVLDLHRDAMERDNQSIVKPVAVIDGKKAAQIMIIAGCDDGSMNMPNWYKNLRFAAAFQDYMEQAHRDLTRPIYLCYRKYNMDLTDGSLLLEFGSNGNTLDEAVYSAELAGQALADLILANAKDGDVQ